MTNGRGAGMASFMTKKKKYKFQVEVCLEELLEVPFVSAVLFAKLRLLDGGNFQDHSRREEVRDHTVKWGARYSFPCKMLANASTGVLERCVLRISVRKECKGGRSFTKLGFVDLNLAEFAGAGETCKKALLEGYDARHRQDNSMLKFSIKMNMLSGDILFKAPSPSLKHKPVATEDPASVGGEPRIGFEEFSSGSLAGSIASGSSGFGSLPKKRPPLLSSDLVIGHTLAEGNVPVTVAFDGYDGPVPNSLPIETEETPCEPGHSRNSSNTSQMSKASGYSSIHSHSRQSSSGDSGHIRELHKPKRGAAITIPSTFPEASPGPNNNNLVPLSPDDVFCTPRGSITPFISENNNLNYSNLLYHTPKAFQTQLSDISDEYRTPDVTFDKKMFPQSPEVADLRDRITYVKNRLSDNTSKKLDDIPKLDRNSLDNCRDKFYEYGVLRSKSDFEIPRNNVPVQKHGTFFQNLAHNSDSIFAFLTPSMKRRVLLLSGGDTLVHSTPKRSSPTSGSLKYSPIYYPERKLSETRTTSLNNLKSGHGPGQDVQQAGAIIRSLPHRKLLEGTPGGKLAPMAISPDETTTIIVSSDCNSHMNNMNSQTPTIRRPSVTQNPSSGSLVVSETGSLDRAKAAKERRKVQDQDAVQVTGRVEGTRVNPDHLIAELIKNTNLGEGDDSAESSGLQLFIAKDGTAALGSHEVKSQMSTGIFKQVVMEDNR